MAQSDHEPAAACVRGSLSKWIFAGFILMVVLLLWQEHRAHLLGFIPYLILLACPLMHLLHRGHHHGEDGPENRHA